jgi:hypothetical protein
VFHKTDRPVRTASATQVRHPIYKTAVGRWRVYEQYLGPLFSALERGGRVEVLRDQVEEDPANLLRECVDLIGGAQQRRRR